MKRIFYLLLVLMIVILINGCQSPEQQFNQQLNQVINEEIFYHQFEENGFSVSYPDWPVSDNNDANVELSVTKGYCSVAINSEKMSAKQWYDLFINSINQVDSSLIASDAEKYYLKYSANYQNITLISENQIYDCNGKAVAVTLTCVEQATETMLKLKEKIFNSVKCEKENKELSYNDFKEDDFFVKYPQWDEMTDVESHLVGVSKGICSIVVDKHNALPQDIFNWISNEQEVSSSSIKEMEYFFTYPLTYQDQKITAHVKILYCNYQSYITQVLCIDALLNAEDQEMIDYVLKHSQCLKVYEVPVPEVIKQEVVDKEPEIIEEIEDEIVKTNVGEEFGIDEELIVYFINNNPFFGKIIKDFPKANLIIEDKDNNRELKLRALISGEGKITLLEDGEYADADVSLFIPLLDALNIFNNAANINPLTLLSFAANVRTEPAGLKNEIIQKVIRGEYN